VCLAAGPALAAPRPLGNILFAEHARLGSVAALAGATVYAGDRLTTDAAGSLRVRVGTGQVYLMAESAILLEEHSTGVSANLTRGTVGFASGEEAPIVVRAANVLIRPKNPSPTHGQVQVVSSHELLVSSFRGSLEVVVGSEVQPVPEATSYRVVLEEELEQDPVGVGAGAAKRTRVTMILLGAGIAATVITFVILQNLSPSRP
jgi:hypothetical protein